MIELGQNEKVKHLFRVVNQVFWTPRRVTRLTNGTFHESDAAPDETNGSPTAPPAGLSGSGATGLQFGTVEVQRVVRQSASERELVQEQHPPAA